MSTNDPSVAKRRPRRSGTAHRGMLSDARANLLQTIAGILFGLAGVIVLMMFIGMMRRKTRPPTRP